MAQLLTPSRSLDWTSDFSSSWGFPGGFLGISWGSWSSAVFNNKEARVVFIIVKSRCHECRMEGNVMLVRAVRARVVLVILGLKSGDDVHGR